MTVESIKKMLRDSESYKFMSKDKNLGNNTILLTLGGSYAYGMNTDNSDIDIRGIALNKKEEILLGIDFEQIEERDTDTVIYSFNKIIKLLSENNPNTLEMLGCKREHYLYMSNFGKELIENRKMFLSKMCAYKFMGYANKRMREVKSKSSREVNYNEYKLGKHMSYSLRLLMMGIDILEKEELITYRENEHDLLMSVKMGDYLDENNKTKDEFYDILNEYMKRLEYAKQNTSLPDKPDYDRIAEFKMYVNERIIKESCDVVWK